MYRWIYFLTTLRFSWNILFYLIECYKNHHFIIIIIISSKNIILIIRSVKYFYMKCIFCYNIIYKHVDLFLNKKYSLLFQKQITFKNKWNIFTIIITVLLYYYYFFWNKITYIFYFTYLNVIFFQSIPKYYRSQNSWMAN